METLAGSFTGSGSGLSGAGGSASGFGAGLLAAAGTAGFVAGLPVAVGAAGFGAAGLLAAAGAGFLPAVGGATGFHPAGLDGGDADNADNGSVFGEIINYFHHQSRPIHAVLSSSCRVCYNRDSRGNPEKH